MTFRSEMYSIAVNINELRDLVTGIVIDLTHKTLQEVGSAYAFDLHRKVSDLEQSLEIAKHQNEEVRTSLHKKGLQQLRAESGVATDRTDEDVERRRPALKPKEQKALDFVRSKGHAKGIVIANHIKVSPARFRSVYVPRLRLYGLRNDRDGDGYYIEEP